MTLANRASALFHTVTTTTKRANELVDEATDFARARFGAGLALERSEVDLDALVRRVAADTARAHPERTIDVVSDGPLNGSYDARRITQLMATLIADAVERSAVGTRVTVTIVGRAADVTINVRNSGPRVEDGARRSVFRPFFRNRIARGVGTRLTRDSDDLGVSMYIAAKIAEGHGGRVEMSSDDEGTTFTVVLPRAER